MTLQSIMDLWLYPFKSSRKPTSPVDTPYIETMSTTLTVFGFWPDKILGKKRWYSTNTIYMIGVYTGIFVFSLVYIRNNVARLSFLDMGINYINTLLAIVVLTRMAIPMTQQYIVMTQDFLHKIHLFHFKDQNEFAMKTYMEVEKLSGFFCLLLHSELLYGVVFYNLTPLFKSYRNGMFKTEVPANATFEHAIYYEMPFDYTTDLKGFLVMYIVNWFVSTHASFVNGILDCYVYVIVFNLWGHLKLLKHNLTHFPRPQSVATSNGISSAWYNEEESSHIRSLLIESLQHYRMIKDFMSDMSDTFGVAICCYFSYFQICGCILLVESFEMTAEAIGTYGILTLVTFQQLIQISVIFELVGTQSDTVPEAVYEAPWECMDVKNRQIVLLYVSITQKPLNFKPMGMVSIGVQTMASILKTSISYFMLLRTVTTEGGL